MSDEAEVASKEGDYAGASQKLNSALTLASRLDASQTASTCLARLYFARALCNKEMGLWKDVRNS
jgi:hypothetical protein